MTQRIIALVVIGSVCAAVLWMDYPVPRWAVVAFVFGLLFAVVPLTARRVHVESRLVRTVWNALTGK